MIKKSTKILVVLLLLLSMAGTGDYRRAFSAETEPPLQKALPQEAQVKEISGYREWEHITPQPWLITVPVDVAG